MADRNLSMLQRLAALRVNGAVDPNTIAAAQGAVPAAPSAPTAPVPPGDQAVAAPLAPAAPSAPSAPSAAPGGAPLKLGDPGFSYTSLIKAPTPPAALPGSSFHAEAGKPDPRDAKYFEDLGRLEYERGIGLAQYGEGGPAEVAASTAARQKIEGLEYQHPRNIRDLREGDSAHGSLYSSRAGERLTDEEHSFATSISNTVEDYNNTLAGIKAMREALISGYTTGEAAAIGASVARYGETQAGQAATGAGLAPKPKMGLQGLTGAAGRKAMRGPAISAPGAITKADLRAAKPKPKKRR